MVVARLELCVFLGAAGVAMGAVRSQAMAEAAGGLDAVMSLAEPEAGRSGGGCCDESGRGRGTGRQEW